MPTPDTVSDDRPPLAAANGDAVFASTEGGRSTIMGGSSRWQFVQTVGVAFAVVILQMAQGVLLARLLGPEGRGQYATSVLYVQLLLYVGLFGGLEVVCRYAANPAVDQPRLRRSALRLGLVTGTVTMFLASILSVIALPDEKRFLMPMSLLCALSIVGQHAALMITAVDRGSGRFGVYNFRRVIAAATFPTLLLIAATCFEVNLRMTCTLFVFASVVSMAVCLQGISRPFGGSRAPEIPLLLRESRPYGVSMLVTDLFERFDLVLVLWLAPLVEQGFYAAMVPIAYPLTVIPNTLGLFLFNAGASGQQRLSRTDMHRILRSSMLIQTLSTIVFLSLIGPVVGLLYGVEFMPAVAFAWWLAPVAALKGILQGLDQYLKGRGRPLSLTRPRVLATVVMVLATWILFPHHGVMAIAMAALASQVVCLVWLSAIVYADVSDGRATL